MEQFCTLKIRDELSEIVGNVWVEFGLVFLEWFADGARRDLQYACVTSDLVQKWRQLHLLVRLIMIQHDVISETDIFLWLLKQYVLLHL